MFIADDWEVQLRIAPMKGVIMLGLKDINLNNKWKTFDGESQTYFKWNSGQPNYTDKSTNPRVNVWMITRAGERQHGAGTAPVGRWNNVSSIKAVPAICFYEPTN